LFAQRAIFVLVANSLRHHQQDCTCKVWGIELDSKKNEYILKDPLHTLFGHDAGVTCVDLTLKLDMIVSASEDGTVIVHTLRGGVYRRTIEVIEEYEGGGGGGEGDEQAGKCAWVGLSKRGYIVVYVKESGGGCQLCVFSINGRLLCRRKLDEEYNCFVFSDDGEVLVSGGESVRFWVIRNLENLTQFRHLAGGGAGGAGTKEAKLDGACEVTGTEKFGAPVTSMLLREGNVENFLVVGLQNGECYVFVHDLSYLRKRLQKKLENLGFF